MAGEPQGDQVVIETGHPQFGSKNRDDLNVNADLIASYLDVPFRVSYDPDNFTFFIQGSEVQLLESDGKGEDGYRRSQAVNGPRRAPSPNVSHSPLGPSSLDIVTGATTGLFANNPAISPSIPANNYISMGVELVNDELFVRFGTPGVSPAAAGAVNFSASAQKKLFEVLLQKDSTTGTWGLLLNNLTDLLIFEGQSNNQGFPFFIEEGGTVRHDPATLGRVEWSGDLKFRPFGTSSEFTIAASTVDLADDEIAYVVVTDPNAGGSLTMQVAARSDLGMLSPDRFAIFHRYGNIIKTWHNLELLQVIHQEFPVSNPAGETVFTVTAGFTFDSRNEIEDIIVDINGNELRQGTDFNKVSSTAINTTFTVRQNAVLTIRLKRGLIGGGGTSGTGATDLENITVNTKPAVAGSVDLGSDTEGWRGLYLKDTTSSQHYRLDIVGGSLQITPVP